MTYRNIVLAICLVVLSIEIVPVCSQPNGMAIIAVRTTAVGSLGHVGVGFQNDDGTWTIGAVENSGGSPVVLDQKGLMGTEIGASDGQSPFSDNDAWVEQNLDLKDAEAKFRSLGYDGFKIIQVSDPNPGNANSVIKDLPKRGYNVVTNNCLSATIDVLNGFGVKNLPFQIAHVAPNDYYANVKGEEYLWDSSKNTYTNLITGSALADNPSTDDEETSSTSAKSVSLSIKELMAASISKVRLQELVHSNPESVNQLSSQVALTLYVRDGSASGPIIPDARVNGQDGAGKTFEQTFDSINYVTIKGTPGTWSFSASANGYETNNWDEEITGSCTKNAFLQMVDAQDDEKTSSTSAKSSSLSIKERFAASKARLVNQERKNFTSQVNPSEVTLTLYVREARDSSPDSNLLIKGAEVKCEDGLGTDSEHTTDSNGRVIITGVSGRWHLRAIAFGHIPVDDVLEVIEDDQTYTIRLSKVQEQDSKHSAKISTKTKSSTKGSKNSIVGKWKIQGDWGCDGHIEKNMVWIASFNEDGTLLDEEDTDPDSVFTWKQSGNTVSWSPAQASIYRGDVGDKHQLTMYPPFYEGTIDGDTMSGTYTTHGSPNPDGESTGCWKAVRVGQIGDWCV